MRVGEEMFAVRASRTWGDTLNDNEDGSDARSCRWPNNIMCILTKHAIRMPRTVRVEMQ